MKISHSAIAVLICIVFSCLCLPMVTAVESISLNPVADAYVSSDRPELNYGSAYFLMVSFYDYRHVGVTKKNSYLLFDLSDISSNVYDIESATLELYQGFSTSAAVQVSVHSCPVTEWDELEITWSNAPSFSSEPLDVEVIAFTDQWYSWNVTEEVKNLQGDYLTLVLATEGMEGDDIYASLYSKDSFLSNHPKLVMQYTVIPEFSTWIMLLSFIVATVTVIIYLKRSQEKTT